MAVDLGFEKIDFSGPARNDLEELFDWSAETDSVGGSCKNEMVEVVNSSDVVKAGLLEDAHLADLVVQTSSLSY